LTWLINIFLFFASFAIVLGFLVFIHEMGHYAVARLCNVAIERFSIGFGKPLIKKRDSYGTDWTISSIPLGGYVKFAGDMGMASNPDHAQLEAMKKKAQSGEGGTELSRLFHFKPLWQRFLIVLGGPVANFLLAIVIFAVIALSFGTQHMRSVVLDVMPGSAAEEAGVLFGDEFLQMDGQDVSFYKGLSAYVTLHSDKAINTVISRDGEELSLNLTPRRTEREDFLGGKNKTGMIGVRFGGEENLIRREYSVPQSLSYGVGEVGRTVSATGTYIKRIFSGKEDGSALGGPLRIATMTGKSSVDVAKLDISIGARIKAMFFTLLQLSAYLSIGLGVANLMPIPVLDGGHLLFYGYEAVAGRPLSQEKQDMGFRIGFALLITFMVLVTFNDIGYIRSFFS